MSEESSTENAAGHASDVATHAAPSKRMLRAMAIVRWGLLAVVTLLAAYSAWTVWVPKRESTTSSTEADSYYCAMHPQIRSPSPGECPICHMDLVPIPEDRRGAQPSASAAPVDTPPNLVPVTVSEDRQRAMALTTIAVEDTTVGRELRVAATIAAPDTGLSQVRVRAAGFIEQVLVSQAGVQVKRGQPLAYVYSPEIYRAQEEFLTTSRWSSATNPSSDAGTPGDITSATRRALELLGLASTDIEAITRSGKPMRAIPVRAPAAGYVTRFNAILGARAEPEMALYEIADLSSVWIIASVNERDLGAIRVGTQVRFALTGATTPPVAARVELIEPQLDEATRTTRVRLVLPNRDGALRPGQYGEVAFELPAAAGIFVPRDAIIRTGEHDYVYVATSADRFEPRTVTTGVLRDGRVQILAGLTAGQRVVTRGSFMIDSESRLQASLAATPASPAASGAPSSPEQGPSCETEFSRTTAPEKYTQCRACERQHAGMGSMVADCKNAIPRPWR